MLTGYDDDAWNGDALSPDIAKQRLASQQASKQAANRAQSVNRVDAAIADAQQGAKSGSIGGPFGAIGGAVVGGIYGAATGDNGQQADSSRVGKALGVTGTMVDANLANKGKDAWDNRTRTRNGVEFTKDDRGGLQSELGDFEIDDGASMDMA